MDETVHFFLQMIKERSHVLQLINNIELLVNLVSGEKRVLIAIKNGEVYLLHDTELIQTNYEISGDIKKLLEGKETLRSLVRKGQLKISAPFRTILLLESIFYLTRAQDHQLAKII
jgi:hypothetical protein